MRALLLYIVFFFYIYVCNQAVIISLPHNCLFVSHSPSLKKFSTLELVLFIVQRLVVSLVNLPGVTQSDPAVSTSLAFFVVKRSKAVCNEEAGG